MNLLNNQNSKTKKKKHKMLQDIINKYNSGQTLIIIDEYVTRICY